MVNNWSFFKRFIHLPTSCLYCGGQVTGRLDLCDHCLEQLPLNQHCCSHCATPLPSGHKQQICGKCLRHPPAFNRAFSPFLYQPPASQLITSFKYQANLAAGNLLANLALIQLQKNKIVLPECLIPVPLHYSRLRQRGFNQSLEIARVFARALSIEILTDACSRSRKTVSQSGLNEKQRRQNIRGAFNLKKQPDFSHIAIVDDVMTTGNTANELAKELRRAGVEYIQVWSVCRADNLAI